MVHTRLWVEPITCFEGSDLLGKARGKVRIYRGLDINTVSADTCLTVGAEFGDKATCSVNIVRIVLRVSLNETTYPQPPR